MNVRHLHPATALARLLLVLAGVGTAFGIGEAVLRLGGPLPPSLRALAELSPQQRFEVDRSLLLPERARLCGATPGGRTKATTTWHGQGQGEPMDLLVAGDSVVHGYGVSGGQSWPERLAEELGQAHGRPVRLSRTGAPGVGYCEWMSETLAAVQAGLRPSAVVLQVFADDIQFRGMVKLGDDVVAIPGYGASPAVQELTRRSHLANQLWFSWAVHRGSHPDLGLDDRAGRAFFLDSLALLTGTLDEHGIPWTTVLVPAAGDRLCDETDVAAIHCDALRRDTVRMATWLTEAGVPMIDGRQVWRDTPPDLLAQERFEMGQRGAVPVHPGPEGHRSLADAVEPWLMDAAPPALVDTHYDG